MLNQKKKKKRKKEMKMDEKERINKLATVKGSVIGPHTNNENSRQLRMKFPTQ